MPPSVTAPDEASSLRAGMVTGLVATIVGVLLATAVAAVSAVGEVSLLGAFRSGARAWLVPLGSGIEVQGASIGLIPVGGTLVAASVVALVVRWVLREPLADVAPFAATVAGTAGVLAAVLSALSDTDQVSTSGVRAAFGAFVVAGLAAAVAAPRSPEVEATPRWLRTRPAALAVARAAARGAVVFLVSCAVIVLVLLVGSLQRAGELWAALDPGAGGSVALGLLCVVAVPTLVLWAGAVVLGPGVQIGTDTTLDLTGAYLGQVPGLPVLAALPGPGAFGDWVVVLGLVPVLAGLAAGWGLVLPGEPAVLRRVGLGAAAGATAGLVVGALVGLSAGSVGPGRMADVGPVGPWAPVLAVLVLGAGGAVGAALAHYRGVRAQQPSAREDRRPRLRFRDQSPGPDRRDD
ncbi:DUF6350 family protein [Aeromicrobium sp. CF4.19]|uniref:cell division protein PerM n=1 Tax=Aeromicrobium sp. CF4.19 TaxID=3373082 RepID=UPI003EE62DA9